MASPISRPGAGEHAAYYAGYIGLVTGEDALDALRSQIADTLETLDGIPESQGGHRYAEDKWTIRETVGHMIDTERVFAYRALRFSRNDATPLPGFDQDLFVQSAPYDRVKLADLAAEFEAVRHSTICLFRNLDGAELERRGTANNAEMSVRAIAWIIAGHELHHLKLLRERYLG